MAWKEIKNTAYPKYLGVTLDRSLRFKKHIQNCKAKVCTRNNILRKLISSHWGASPHTLRISALTLCYSAADYACPVWSRSAYAHRLDPALNDSCHIITGCLKSTNTNCLYLLAGIAPPDIRREVASRRERQKARHDPSHMLYRSEAVNQRLKSRKSFLHNTPLLNMPSEEMRIEQWKNRVRECPLKPAFNIEPAEVLAPGHQVSWKEWRCLKRLRTGTVKTRSTLAKWKFHNGPTLCKCVLQMTLQHTCFCTVGLTKARMGSLRTLLHNINRDHYL